MNSSVIDTAKICLQSIFEKHHDKGVSAIYLWGSITTADFDPSTSDIDSIAIVEDHFDENLESVIQAELQSTYGDANRCGFRVLYVSELKSGRHIRSNVSSFMSPVFFIFDLPNWMYVAGKNYLQTDFTHVVPSVDDVLEARVAEIINRRWQDASSIEPGKEQYYIKCLWRIMHLMQIKRGLIGPFSYAHVIDHANKDEEEIVSVLNDIRKSNYDRDTYLKHVHTLNACTASLIAQGRN